MNEAGDSALRQADESPRRPVNTARDWLRLSAIAAVTVLVFFFIFRDVPFAAVGEILRGARFLPLVAGFAITLAFPPLSAARWRCVMEGMGCRIALRESMGLVLASWTLSIFTPSKGGDLAKAYFLRGRFPVSSVLGSVLAVRLVDTLVLLAFCLAGSLVFGWRALSIASAVVLGLGLAGAAGLLAIRLPVPARLRLKVDRLLEAVRVLAKRPRLLLIVALLAAANWSASIAQTWLFYRALSVAVPVAQVVAALPAAIFVGLLPVTIAGMGTRDAALIRLMAGHALPAVSLSVGILYSLCGYWLPGLAGLPFLRWALGRGKSTGEP